VNGTGVQDRSSRSIYEFSVLLYFCTSVFLGLSDRSTGVQEFRRSGVHAPSLELLTL
jgi:hypothetical protein